MNIRTTMLRPWIGELTLKVANIIVYTCMHSQMPARGGSTFDVYVNLQVHSGSILHRSMQLALAYSSRCSRWPFFWIHRGSPIDRLETPFIAISYTSLTFIILIAPASLPENAFDLRSMIFITTSWQFPSLWNDPPRSFTLTSKLNHNDTTHTVHWRLHSTMNRSTFYVVKKN